MIPLIMAKNIFAHFDNSIETPSIELIKQQSIAHVQEILDNEPTTPNTNDFDLWTGSMEDYLTQCRKEAKGYWNMVLHEINNL